MQEIWKDVPGWVGFYQVSNSGRVRSLPRIIIWVDKGIRRPRPLKGKILKQQISTKGYRKVSLTKPGKRTQPLVHDLVLTAFRGPKPKELQACHNDGDKANNRPDNLRYDTCQANINDRERHRKMGLYRQ